MSVRVRPPAPDPLGLIFDAKACAFEPTNYPAALENSSLLCLPYSRRNSRAVYNLEYLSMTQTLS